MRDRCNRRFLKGAIAGMIGGLVGSWTMNRFQSGVRRVEEAWEKSAHRPEPKAKFQDSGDGPATAVLAQRISLAVLGRTLTHDEMQTAEPLVHYGFGMLAGGLYGLLAELTPVTTKGAGCAYGTAVWLGGDEIAVPRLELSKTPDKYPLSVHAEALASHVAYGVTLEGVRRGVRAML